jgi:hypothetical protein
MMTMGLRPKDYEDSRRLSWMRHRYECVEFARVQEFARIDVVLFVMHVSCLLSQAVA